MPIQCWLHRLDNLNQSNKNGFGPWFGYKNQYPEEKWRKEKRQPANQTNTAKK